MNVLRFRRDRRQRDPFAAAPVAAPEAPRPAPEPPAYDTRMDVEATLAGLAAQARRDAAPWGPWDQPGSFPAALRAVPGWHGHDLTVMDSPPHHDRPYIPGVLGGEGRLSPRSAGVAEDLAGLVLFRFSVERMTRPCCEQCQRVSGDWRERLYGTFRHHTQPVDAAAPRQFGIATELRQAHGETAAAADRAESQFAARYLTERAA